MGFFTRLAAFTTWLIPLSILIGLVAAWELWVQLADVPKWQLPAPSAIFKELNTSSDLLWTHTLVTLREIVVGFLAALIAGLFLAGAIAYSRVLERSVYPIVNGSFFGGGISSPSCTSTIPLGPTSTGRLSDASSTSRRRRLGRFRT